MEKQRPLINFRQPFLELLLVIALLLLFILFFFRTGAVLVTSIFHVSIYNLSDLYNPNNISAIKLLQVFYALGYLAPALFFAFLMGQKNDYLKINGSISLIPVLLVVGIMFLSQPIVNYLGDINSHLQLPAYFSKIQNLIKSAQDEADTETALFLKMPNLKDLIINLIVIAAIPAICEEAFFRGTIQQILIKWFRNKHVAVWVTGAFFSAVHFEFFGFLPRMVLGAMLGYVFLWSGNLWYSIIGHMVNNGLAVIAYYLYQAKIVSYNPDSNDTGPAWLILAGTALFIVLLVFYHNYFKHHPPGEEDIVEAQA